MTQQTAVEWLLKELRTEMGYGYDLGKTDTRVLDEIIQQAKKMEKEQIVMAHSNKRCTWDHSIESLMCFSNAINNAEKYYNETFGNK